MDVRVSFTNVSVEQPVASQLLDQLRHGSIELPGDALPLRVGIDSELDRGGRFGSVGG
jgi:hypothetical protein